MDKQTKNIKVGSGRRIGIIFVIVALLPALFYSVYEISSLNSTEELFQSIYSKQLDIILFSINQYALDAAQSWAGEVNLFLLTSSNSRTEKSTRDFLAKRPAVRAVFYSDTALSKIEFVTLADSNNSINGKLISKTLRNSYTNTIERLSRYASIGYRKIEPITIGDSTTQKELLLLFVTNSESANLKIAGMLIDAEIFFTEVLQAKLSESAGEEFLLSIIHLTDNDIVVTTSPVEFSELRQTKTLWLFPDYAVGIKMKGTSIESIVRERTKQNLILIGILNLVLIGTVWLVFRTFKRELELIRLKGDFVSNVSHELRTPLSLIRMFAETLTMKRIKTEKKKQEYYNTILQETERLSRLINNILNFSRMEAGKKEYHFETVALNEVVSEVMKTYATHIEQEGFTLQLKLGDSLPIISADREAVAEALINILDNAIKYSNADKFIRAQTGIKDGTVFVEVEDHGIGIDRHHHKKIFDTFYRVSSGLTNNIKGSGLGLSLVQHIMDSHKGKIEVDSAIGKGSTFRLLFPIVNYN